jgi:hypothetical protein
MPGIEYEKCDGSICDLDHTDGATYEQSIKAQEPYRIATIIDFVLDEDKRTAYFILEFHDEQAYERVKTGKLKYVSPSIWPSHGGYERLGVMDNDLPMLDVFHWKGLHIAFVNNPAFGEEARVKATCEGGEDCQMRLLTASEAKELAASVLVRHAGQLMYVSVPEIKDLGRISESELLPVLRANTSFTSCACNSAQSNNMGDEKPEKIIADLKAEKEQLTAKVTDLTTKLDQALKAATKKAQEECPDGKEMVEGECKEKMKAKSAKTEEPEEVKTLKAQIAALSIEAKQPFIAKMMAARKVKGASDEQLTKFEESLKAKSFEDIKGMYANEEIFIKDLSAKTEEEKLHFEFNGGQEPGALTGKSLESILDMEDDS